MTHSDREASRDPEAQGDSLCVFEPQLAETVKDMRKKLHKAAEAIRTTGGDQRANSIEKMVDLIRSVDRVIEQLIAMQKDEVMFAKTVGTTSDDPNEGAWSGNWKMISKLEARYFGVERGSAAEVNKCEPDDMHFAQGRDGSFERQAHARKGE